MRYNGFLLVDYAEESSLIFKHEHMLPDYIIDAYTKNIHSLDRIDVIIIINPGNIKINNLHPCLIQYKSYGSGNDFADWFEVEIT